MFPCSHDFRALDALIAINSGSPPLLLPFSLSFFGCHSLLTALPADVGGAGEQRAGDVDPSAAAAVGLAAAGVLHRRPRAGGPEDGAGGGHHEVGAVEALWQVGNLKDITRNGI